MVAPKICIIAGNGFNCEKETSYAFSLCGGDPVIIHMNDVISKEVSLSNFQVLAIVGGFSYGDHLGSGKVAANIFKSSLSDELLKFINRDTLTLGTCNGFQIITLLGLLPAFDNNYLSHTVTISQNSSARYEDRWVNISVNKKSPCVFTKELDKLYLPIRHGEGKVFSPDHNVIDRIKYSQQIALQYCDPITGQPTQEYPHNPNGSLNAIAGMCDETGRVFGLIPHIEACLSPYSHPSWTRMKSEDTIPAEGDGVQIFRNAISYFN